MNTNSSLAKLLAVLILASSYFSFNPVQAADSNTQRILELRKQIAELQKKSDQYKSIVATSQKQEASLKREINILNNQISDLQVQIQITEKEISATRLDIGELGTNIVRHEDVITDKKAVVANLITLLYQRDQENEIAMLLKNNSLSDFFNDLEATKNLNSDLLASITVLKTEKEALEKNKAELEGKKQELESLSQSAKIKAASLNNTKYSKDDLLQKTKGKEELYQKMLEGVEADQDRFFAELRQLENNAIANNEIILHVTANYVPPRNTNIFKYPHEKYRLTQGYGYTAFAKRGAYNGNPHNGVDVAGGCGTPITPIGDGEILVSGTNGGYGNWVAVRHQYNLVSIYAHMRAPSGLNNGTKVTTRDVIGFEGTTGNSTGCHVHLGLYKDFFTYPSSKTGELYFNYFQGSLNPLDYLP